MKKITFFFILAAFVHSSTGQTPLGITEITGFTNNNSIVRAVNDKYTLIYTYETGSMQGSFILYEHSTRSAHYFNTPSKMQVKDMEIQDGTVYFCGNGSSNQAFVGQFDIMGCFSGTDPFYYCIVPAALPYPVEMNTAVKMTTMKYMGDVYILAIGDATHYYTEPTPYVASVLFSAYLTSPTGSWDFRVDYQKVRPFTYTDIDCSDNYVVFTAVDANDYAYFLVSHHDPVFFYNSAYVYPYDISLGCQVEDDQLLLKAMNGDRFTIAYVPQGGNWIDLVDVPLPLPTPLPPLNHYSTLPSASTPYVPNLWRIHDLRHNNITDRPLLLGEMALPPYDNFDTWVTEFDWAGTSSSQNNTPRKKFSSLDGVNGYVNYVVTDHLSPLSIGKEQSPIPLTSCFNQQPVAINRSLLSVDAVFLSNHYPCNASNSQPKIYPEILPLEPRTICE